MIGDCHEMQTSNSHPLWTAPKDIVKILVRWPVRGLGETESGAQKSTARQPTRLVSPFRHALGNRATPKAALSSKQYLYRTLQESLYDSHRLQRVHPLVNLDKDMSPPAPAPTRGATIGHKLLTSEGHAPIPAVASFDIHLQERPKEWCQFLHGV